MLLKFKLAAYVYRHIVHLFQYIIKFTQLY